MNKTIGSWGVSSLQLVIGVQPRMPMRAEDLPEHRERANSWFEAGADMAKHIARMHLKLASCRSVPAAADRDNGPGMRVFVYRKRPASWEGPFAVIDCDRTQVWHNVNKGFTLVSVPRLKEYVLLLDVTTRGDASAPAARALPTTVVTGPTPAGTAADNPSTEVDAAPAPSAAAAHGRRADIGSMHVAVTAGDTLKARMARTAADVRQRIDTAPDVNLYITEVLRADDSRAPSSVMKQVSCQEVENLKARLTWVKVQRTSVPKCASLVGERFI